MDDLDAWVAAFIAAEREPAQSAQWVARTWEAIADDVPAMAQDPDLTALIQRAIGEHWQAFLDQLSGQAAEFRLVPTAADLALELARRHLDLTPLFGIYRAAQRASWTYATDVVRAAPDALDHEAILVVFWTRAAQWLDASVEESIRLHQNERARIERRGDAQRFEAVRAVLAGDLHEPHAISATLGGYPVSGSHVALVLTALVPEALATLEPTALALAAQLGSRHPLVVRPSGQEIWCWVAAPLATTLTLDDPQIRVTVAGPHGGVDGFVLAHTEARAALPAALARNVCVTSYDDIAAITLLHADPEAAQRFTRRVLGPLIDPAHAPLRHTARIVLSHPGSADEVAATLGLHKNTVRYRVSQIERLLGRSIRERVGDLVLALDYAEVFLDAPSAVTRPRSGR